MSIVECIAPQDYFSKRFGRRGEMDGYPGDTLQA